MSREVITPTQPQDALESCAKPRGVSTLCLGKLWGFHLSPELMGLEKRDRRPSWGEAMKLIVSFFQVLQPVRHSHLGSRAASFHGTATASRDPIWLQGRGSKARRLSRKPRPSMKRM